MDRVEYQTLIIQDILNLHKSKELNISPWYQRRSIWTRPQKAYLINTILEQKPIPAIYIRHALDLDKGKSIREVVDGQQRIRSILEFCNDEFSVRHPQTASRKSFSQLNKSQRETFLLTAISVGNLLAATDEDVIDIFGRINSVSKNLNDQEKRNSRFSGEFKQFCLNQASSRVKLWREFNIFSANDIARMNEVQFVSDLALNLLEGLSDFGAARLDSIYGLYDEEFPHHADLSERFDKLFDFIVDLGPSFISDTIFVRQPIFFSLLVVLDALKKLDASKIEKALFDIDSRFNDEDNQTEADKQFVVACTSTTQRIRQRTIRNDYISEFFK